MPKGTQFLMNRVSEGNFTIDFVKEAMCHANGRNYEVGESFRNGSFHVKCSRDGLTVAGWLEMKEHTSSGSGCYVQGRFDELLMAGESRLIEGQKHECFSMPDGRLRYTVMSMLNYY